MYSRYNHNKCKPFTASSKYVNNRFLTTPEKNEKLKNLQIKVCNAEKELKDLRQKVAKLKESLGVRVDESLHIQITEQHDRKSFQKAVLSILFGMNKWKLLKLVILD